jgi:hypothetical protein
MELLYSSITFPEARMGLGQSDILFSFREDKFPLQ